MTDWQVNVTYTHSDSWEGYRQTCEIGQFAGLVDKLNRGEDVTFIFYGDSITNGASASFVYNYAPQQYSYPLLLTQALADLFGYNVHYVQTGLNGTSRIPNQDYTVENARGTITYINPAIGGWNTQQGLDNYDSHVKPFIEQYGCDLFVLAFGMNDAGGAPRTIAATQKKILNRVLEQSPAAGLLIVSTMVPNPDATNGWYGNQEKQQKSLQSLAEDMRARNASCAVACMTSVSKAVLEHKSFRDYSGNNINHPNDFFSRVYAQCLLELLGKNPIPRYCDDHNDIVTCFDAGTADALVGFCRGVQAASPVDSYAAPEPCPEPGYTDEVIMASGSFTQGSTIELSCDGPLRAPYTCYLQGGLNFAASRAGVLLAVQNAYFKN